VACRGPPVGGSLDGGAFELERTYNADAERHVRRTQEQAVYMSIRRHTEMIVNGVSDDLGIT